MILEILRDLRYGLRGLRRSPAFAAVAILTVALGIGANTAVFSFLDKFLLQPLPYPEPDQIVNLTEISPAGRTGGVSTLTFLDWQKQATSFQFLAGQSIWNTTLTGIPEPQALRGARISASYFDIAKIKPFLGRTFTVEEEQSGKDRVIVLGYPLWLNALGGDRNVIGKSVQLDNTAYTVIGVMPQGSVFDRTFAALWRPLAFEPSDMNREARWFGAFARLKPGVSLEQANAEMRTLASRISQENPATNKGWTIRIRKFADLVTGDEARSQLLILAGAAALVLLIGCVNLASLLLARGTAREAEVSLRAALGANRRRLIRQFITESVLIALIGGVLGLGVGYAIMKWLNAQLPPGTLPAEVIIQMDGRVLVFALLLSILTGAFFGLIPAWNAARADLTNAIKEGGRGSTAGKTRGRQALVVAEIALAFVLLAGAGLLIRSFFGLLNVDPGFQAANVLTLRVPTPRVKYPDPAQLNGYLRDIRAAVNAVAGVEDSSFTSALPLRGWSYGMQFALPGITALDRSQRPTGFFKMVTPSYFSALGIKVKQGRALTEQDNVAAPKVLMINETLAKRYFGSANPVGRQVIMQETVPGKAELGPDLTWEIVGVIADEKINALNDDRSAGLYVNLEQAAVYNPFLAIKTRTNPRLNERSIRQAILSLNPDQPLSDIKTMEEITAESTVVNRLETTLFGIFSALALLLSAVGIYGVLSYVAAQRTNEMGIRAALGATSGNLRGLILGNGLLLTSVGLILGAIGAIALTRLMSSMLYGVSARDPFTLVGVALVLGSVALIACYIPARRAARLDPLVALRQP